nr:MAG: hypothetical protein [Bacteriophage sp.]
MSQVDNDDLPQVDELDSLKARADILGIKYHPSISVDTLRERVNAVISNQSTGEATRPAAGETDIERRSRKKREASAMVRVRIHCNDPAKKEWPGEYITVGNSYVGTYRKYVPYNIDEPWHLPQIIVNALREKRVQVFTTKRGKHGIPIRESKSIAAYTIEVLPPLTAEELESLAREQQARRATDDNA